MFPQRLHTEIENLFLSQKTTELVKHAQGLSKKYRGQHVANERLLQTEQEALVYAATRMPATYGAVSSVFEKILEVCSLAPKSMIDVGAGTGVCGWVASEYFDLEKMICLEREKVMRNLGQALMQASDNPVLMQAQWAAFDILSEEIPQTADLVTASYVLNELAEEACLQAISKLWQATKQVLVIVEPGTPHCFSFLRQIRDMMTANGAYVLAPCPHQNPCPLEEGDWCHFSARIARSRLHKQLKSADMGYEDEKYCFMAFSKQPIRTSYQRIIKPPRVNKASVDYEICASDGQISRQNVSIRDKSAYKSAKKMQWGDILS